MKQQPHTSLFYERNSCIGGLNLKQQLFDLIKRGIKQYPWTQDPIKYQQYLAGVAETINGTQNACNIEGSSWVAAWKELGLKGKPTRKALRGLDGEVVSQ